MALKLVEKLKDPVFLKESTNASDQIQKLKDLEPLLNKEGQMLLNQDIKKLEYGIVGEKNIAFELKNTHMPMYILHDIYLEQGDLSAQIDYLVFTKKLCFVIECKNLYGNIEINNAGDFIRTTEFNGKKRKEGIYSPITQNQRHLDLIKKIKVERQKNMILKFLSNKVMDSFYKPIVVLANPKTVLNAKFAKREDKNKVIRADQLVNYIKSMHQQSKESEVSDSQLLKWAQSFLDLHKEVEMDYTQKYSKYLVSTEGAVVNEEIKSEEMVVDLPITSTVDVRKTDIYKELKAYRLQKSKEENVKPYLIYYDFHLEDLVSKMPTSLEKLEQVSGFGKVKTEKYGPDLIEIVKKYVWTD